MAPPAADWPPAPEWASPAAPVQGQGPDIAGEGPAPTRADPWADLSGQPAAPEPAPSNPEATRWDTYYYKPEPAAAEQPPASPPTQTQLPYNQGSYGQGSSGQGFSGQGFSGQGSSGQAGYGPPSYGQGAPAQGSYGQVPPHVRGTAGPHPLRRGQTFGLIAIVLVLLLAVGGGAYALVSHFTSHKTAAAPSGHPTVSAPAKTATPAASSTPDSSAGGTASASPTGSPTSSPTASPTSSPKAGLTISPGASANPAEPGVAALVSKYFTAINAHDYNAYNNLLEPQLQANDSPSTFHSGYGSTTDLNERLTSISDTSNGEAATLSFTSHQSAAHSATGTACTNWTITLYLEPSGSSYLIGPAPSGYHAHYAAC